MSEEEKAIEYFGKRILKTKVRYLTYIDSKKARILLNYIDKLQKENKNAEERNYSLGLDFIQIGEKLGLENFGKQVILLEIDTLQRENEYYKKENLRIKKDLNTALNYSKKYTISKDKIRELREIDNIDHLQFKLKELLEE